MLHVRRMLVVLVSVVAVIFVDVAVASAQSAAPDGGAFPSAISDTFVLTEPGG